MRLTLKEISDKYQAFNKIIAKKLPIKLSYAISKNMTTLEDEAKVIDDNRIKLAQTYAEKNEDGSPKVINNSYVIDDIESFNKELSEYYKTEIDIDMCKVNSSILDKLDDPKYDVLSPSEIMTLQFMLDDDDPGTTEN